MPDAEKLAAVRAALPSTSAAIQLNTGSVGPMPAEVAAAMAELEAYERDFGRAQYEYHLEALQRMDEARAGVAAVIGGDLDEVAITHAATDGMNLGTWSVDWRGGGRAVTTCHEHAGGVGPLYSVRDRFGVELGFAEFAGDAPDDEILAQFDRLITPGTKLVSLSHVLWTTGLVMPVARIATLAHERGALVLVDGAQAAGAIPVSVRDLGADMYALPAQKWLLGPEGLGAFWIRRELFETAGSSFAGYLSYASYDSRGNRVAQPDARRFQVTNYHRPSVVGMARAIGWLTMYVGLDFVHRRGAAMARYAADALAGIDGVALLTPRDRMAGLISFRIAGWPAEAALDELQARTFSVARTLPMVDALRISVGFWTTEEELDRFIDGVRLLAAHTPESIPPRRSLTIVGSQAQPARSVTLPSPVASPRRSWLAVRWRQFRNAPRPVARAVVSSLSVAIVLGLAYLAYDVALSRGSSLPGGDQRLLAATLYVGLVLVAGSLITWLIVPLPRGSGTRSTRTPWSAALGFFAAIPIAYLVLVVAVQILKPLLV
jgi:L-cysteine/cystine lyase